MAVGQTLPQYDYIRKKTEQSLNAQNQQDDDAMKRRFAAMGGLNTGAYQKQQQIRSDNAMTRRQDALQGIDFQEAAEKNRLAEIEAGRQFARQERLGSQEFANQQRIGSQDFTAGQADLMRKFQTGERLSAQDFANLQRIENQNFTSGENAIQRRFASDEAAKGREFTTSERLSSQQFTAGENKATRDQAQKQFEQNFGLQRDIFDFDKVIKNKQISLAEAEALRDEITTIMNAGTALAQAADDDDVNKWLERAKGMYAGFGQTRFNSPNVSVPVNLTGQDLDTR